MIRMLTLRAFYDGDDILVTVTEHEQGRIDLETNFLCEVDSDNDVIVKEAQDGLDDGRRQLIHRAALEVTR